MYTVCILHFIPPQKMTNQAWGGGGVLVQIQMGKKKLKIEKRRKYKMESKNFSSDIYFMTKEMRKRDNQIFFQDVSC